MARKKQEEEEGTTRGERERPLGAAIGVEVRNFRQKLGLTVQALSDRVGLSAGSLSKIENGIVLPSIPTVFALASALHVPVTALFRKFDQERDVTYVRSGEGLAIERRGTRAGHQYQLLGHTVGKRDIAVEPYMCTLMADSEVFPMFQHPGIEFLYMVEGEMVYRQGNRNFSLSPGDSLFFDSDVPHGPEELIKVPIRFLAVLVYSRSSD